VSDRVVNLNYRTLRTARWPGRACGLQPAGRRL